MSAPLLSILYARTEQLIRGRWYELGEPLSATFARELVDFTNKTVLTAAQAAQLSAYLQAANFPSTSGSGSGTHGVVAIGSGADFVTVSGLGLSVAPTQCIVSVMKQTGKYNVFATCRYDTLTTDGFTADLDAQTDDGTYKLAYFLI